jgi:hypothetical protein
MAGTRYEYRLWRKHGKTGLRARLAEDRQVSSTNTGWFDLSDKAATVEEMARLVARFGDQKTSIEGYWLEILDPATHQRITVVEPSGYDLTSVMNGNGNGNPGRVPRARPPLDDISNEELVREMSDLLRELFRRLQAR